MQQKEDEANMKSMHNKDAVSSALRAISQCCELYDAQPGSEGLCFEEIAMSL